MQKKLLLGVALGLSLGTTLTLAWAGETKAEISVVRGVAQVRQADGKWVASSKPPVGSWVRSSQGDTTVRLPGLTMRLEKGASVRVAQASTEAAQLDAKGGRIYVKVDKDSRCQVATTTKKLEATAGEFVLDAGADEKLYVVEGHAAFKDGKKVHTPLIAWAKEDADGDAEADGPDRRVRATKPEKFTQGEENTGKRLGEDETPSPSPSATYSPTATPTPRTAVTPSPTPTSTPTRTVTDGGGSDIWPIVGGLAGAGGLAAFLLTRDDDDNNNGGGGFIVFPPASP